MIDLDSVLITNLKTHPLGNIFGPDVTATARESTENNCTRGYYAEGTELFNSASDIIRKQVEKCDQIQGFHMNHALCKGTGYGVESLLISQIQQ